MRLEGAQVLQAVLLRALRAAQGPSPGPRLPPGYLRALTAEAAPAASTGGSAAATVAEAVVEGVAASSGTGAAAAAAAAEHATQRTATAAMETAGPGLYDATLASMAPGLSAAGQRRPRGAGPRDKAYHNRLASFEGLTQVLAQQQAVLAEANPTAAAARSTMSPALQAMTWHQRCAPPSLRLDMLAASLLCRGSPCASAPPTLTGYSRPCKGGVVLSVVSIAVQQHMLCTAMSGVNHTRLSAACCRSMDDTPAGRELRRNWQRQIILETQAWRACCMPLPTAAVLADPSAEAAVGAASRP